MYSKTTQHIQVDVITEFLENESSELKRSYVWAYHIVVQNHSNQPVQLLGRHWQIVNAQGQKEEVRGKGVIGEQPVIQPGGSYQYSSSTLLNTPYGMMFGSYEMQAVHLDESFWVEIPAFSLHCPNSKHVIN